MEGGRSDASADKHINHSFNKQALIPPPAASAEEISQRAALQPPEA